MNNYVDFFRYSEQYEDVFIEDGHYLYACAEPFSRAWEMCTNDYHACGDVWIRHDTTSADTAYLEGLERAPHNVACAIILCEYRIALRLSDVPSEDWGAYLEQKREELNSC